MLWSLKLLHKTYEHAYKNIVSYFLAIEIARNETKHEKIHKTSSLGVVLRPRDLKSDHIGWISKPPIWVGDPLIRIWVWDPPIGSGFIGFYSTYGIGTSTWDLKPKLEFIFFPSNFDHWTRSSNRKSKNMVLFLKIRS